MNWYLKVLRKYASFGGRAQRAELWYFFLFHFLAVMAMAVVDGLLGTDVEEVGYGLVTALYLLAVVLPVIAVQVRRLHDTGRSGWWFFVYLVPIFGALAMLYFFVQDSQPGGNEFGPNPKEGLP